MTSNALKSVVGDIPLKLQAKCHKSFAVYRWHIWRSCG